MLTNMGALTLYTLIHTQYTKQEDISTHWLKQCSANWETTFSTPQKKIAALHCRAHSVFLTGKPVSFLFPLS